MFIWLHQFLVVTHRFFIAPDGIFVVVCGLSSCAGCVGSAVVACGFQNTQASVVAEGGLGCSIVCGILVPQPGIQPMYPALQGGSLTAGPPGKPRSPHFCDNLPLAFLYNFIFHINFKIYFLIKALWWFSH